MNRVFRFALVIVIAGSWVTPLPSSATHNNKHCFTRFNEARTIADGRFMGRDWFLSFYRDRGHRPCLTTDWHKYGSIYPFRVRNGHPRLGMLDLAGTEAPGGDQVGPYLMTAYVSERVSRATFRLDGTSDEIRIVVSPAWTGLRKNLFFHLIKGDRFDRDRTGRLRLFDRHGRLMRTKMMRRGDFIPSGTIG